jgi:hypothetical protein
VLTTIDPGARRAVVLVECFDLDRLLIALLRPPRA